MFRMLGYCRQDVTNPSKAVPVTGSADFLQSLRRIPLAAATIAANIAGFL
jgi:hypothetical protein